MKRFLNGYVENFYVLGNKAGNGFINHSSSKILITDPMKSRKFDSLKEALDFIEENKNSYEQLFPHQIKVTVELI
ncbi:MAG TPA: hypothetical protein VIK72_09455 [Clostridiaceae bacterium]